jgi:hypothetical protein
VNTLTVSGMIAPASVPHEMMTDSFHHRPAVRLVPMSPVPPRLNSAPAPGPIRKYEMRKVSATATIEVSHTSTVSGCSKSILSAFWNFGLVRMFSLMR